MTDQPETEAGLRRVGNIVIDDRPRCPTCGHLAHVQSGDEGQKFYEPDEQEVEAEAQWWPNTGTAPVPPALSPWPTARDTERQRVAALEEALRALLKLYDPDNDPNHTWPVVQFARRALTSPAPASDSSWAGAFEAARAATADTERQRVEALPWGSGSLPWDGGLGDFVAWLSHLDQHDSKAVADAISKLARIPRPEPRPAPLDVERERVIEAARTAATYPDDEIAVMDLRAAVAALDAALTATEETDR